MQGTINHEISHMRIACYGHARENDGSGTSSNFLIIKELLKRGHQIDLYGWPYYNRPENLDEYSNFQFINLPEDFFLKKLEHLLPKESWLTKRIYPIIHFFLVTPQDRQNLCKKIKDNHNLDSYDLVLFLGLHAPFSLTNLPVISYPQGPPRTEWLSIMSRKEIVFNFGGRFFYLKALIHYFFKDNFSIPRQIKNSDHLIVYSNWAKYHFLRNGVSSGSIKVLPMAVNLDKFSPLDSQKTTSKESNFTLLWLGRVEPRKRFDLMIDAFRLIIKERQDVRLKVVGKFRHVDGYQILLEDPELNKFIEYYPYVDRSDIPELLNHVDLLVQPSENENFGSSVSEALACGLPVILGPTNGTKEFIDSESFVFEEYTPESLRDTISIALKRVETNSELMRKSARQIAEIHFDAVKITNEMEETLMHVSEEFKKKT
jgi:glycosyltransferase involved in cell wall biosynthesis